MDAKRRANVMRRWEAILAETPDTDIAALTEKFEALKTSNPLVYKIIEPAFERRLREMKSRN